MFFHTSLMSGQLNHYPHTLFIDGTYCTNRYGLPLYCFLLADGVRHKQPVGYDLVRDETGTTVKDRGLHRQASGHYGANQAGHVRQNLSRDECCRDSVASAKISIFKFHVLQILDRYAIQQGDGFEGERVPERSTVMHGVCKR